jgi:hypothetical protein
VEQLFPLAALLKIIIIIMKNYAGLDNQRKKTCRSSHTVGLSQKEATKYYREGVLEAKAPIQIAFYLYTA